MKEACGRALESCTEAPSEQQQLSVADVTKIIQQAQASGADPVSTAMQIFNNLGNNISVTGDILREAMKDPNPSVR